MTIKIQNSVVTRRGQNSKLLRKNTFKEFCKMAGKKSQFLVMLMPPRKGNEDIKRESIGSEERKLFFRSFYY